MNNFSHELQYRGKKVMDCFDKRIIICGCGAIGSNLAENLVRQGFKNLTLIDFDRVEAHNINTQTYNSYDVGVLKVVALGAALYDIANEVCINEISKRLDSSNVGKFLKEADLVIDAFDNTEARQILKDYGKLKQIPILHGGLHEDYAEVFWNDNYIVPQVKEGLDVCDYPLARNIVILLVAVISEEIIKLCTDEDLNNWSVTLKDLKITNT